MARGPTRDVDVSLHHCRGATDLDSRRWECLVGGLISRVWHVSGQQGGNDAMLAGWHRDKDGTGVHRDSECKLGGVGYWQGAVLQNGAVRAAPLPQHVHGTAR